MIARLYDGETRVGSLEIGHREPYVIRVKMALSGAVVAIGHGLEDSLIPPGEFEAVYVKEMRFDVGTWKHETRYVLRVQPIS